MVGGVTKLDIMVRGETAPGHNGEMYPHQDITGGGINPLGYTS